MRRVALVLVGALLGVYAQALHPSAAMADPPASCRQYSFHGICMVEAESNGSGDQPATRAAFFMAVSAAFSILTALLLNLAVQRLVLVPIRRVIRHMVSYAGAPEDPRLLTPQIFGVGWSVNLGRLVALLRGRASDAQA